MKKRFTFLLAALALLAMIAQPNRAIGQTKDSYSYTFTAKQFSANNQTITLNDVDWTFAGTGGDYFGYDNTKGQQFGSGNKPYSAITFSTSGIPGTITEIKVNTSGANSIAATMNVTVGGNAYDDQITLTSTATEYTFSGSASGAIAFNYTQTSSKAIYIKSISVTYSTGGGSIPSITISNNEPLDYDATNGSFSYTINNPVSGGQLGFTEDVDWIFDVMESATAGNMITFSTTTNTSSASRTGIITLTYNYGESSVSQGVTITQEGNPNVVYTTIPELFDAATSTETTVNVTFGNWVVTGVSTNGKNVFVTDGTNGFLIYKSNGGLGDTYTVGNTLSGTASCALKLQNGSAQLSNVDASALTIGTGGTVDFANIEMADLTGLNTGALVHYENLVCSVVSGNTNRYYLSDGTTTLQVYNSLFDFDALEDGNTYNISGVYQQYNTTKEVLPRSADDIEEVEDPAEPSITFAQDELNLSPVMNVIQIPFTYENIVVDNFQSFTVHHYDVTGDEIQLGPSSWYYVGVTGTNEEGYQVTGATNVNDGEARTAYIKVSAFDANQNEVFSNLVTINQAEATYTTLPFAFDGGKSNIASTDGLYAEGLGSDYSNSPKLKFDSTDDMLLLLFQETPDTLTFDIKGNSFSDGTFKVQTSENGVSFTDLETYTELGAVQHESFTNLGENVRYIKWVYTEKVNGNVALGNIKLAKHVEAQPSITLNQYEFNYDAKEHDGYIIVTYDMVDSETADVMLCDDEGEELTYEWIDAELDSDRNVHFFMGTNGSTARTAYLKVYAYTSEQQLVSSDLVTINQEAYAAPEASITIDPDTFELDANAHMAESLTQITYQDIEVVPGSGYETFNVQYYDAEGYEIESTWCTIGAVAQSDYDFDVAIYAGVNNEDESRTAYFKLYGYDADGDPVYSNLVTVTQAAAVVDYAVLPFVWEGGSSADFSALNGTTLYGNGSDYAAANAPYLIKLDGNGDYIQVKTDSQPGKVTIGVKMIGGGSTSSITVQGSSDGQTFTDIETLTISGSSNSELTLETSNPFGEDDRYVKMVFTKGSNVGVGPITIAKGTAPSITVTPATLDLEAVGSTGGQGGQIQQLAVTYHNFEITETGAFAVQYYDADGEEQTQPDWITPNPTVVVGGNEMGYNVYLIITANEGAARSAYLKVYATVDNEIVYSNLVTINQAGIDYATLPFAFDGGRADIENVAGLTQEGLDSDYSASPKLKFKTEGSWVVLKLDQAPASLSYDIKGNSFSDGTFDVQTSADGTNYDPLATYTELGATQTITHIDLDPEVRYIKWVYTNKTNGNVALGNIHASLDYDIYGDVTTAELIVTPDRTCTVYSGATLNVTQQLNNVGTAADFIIEEGGQLIHNEGTVAVTMKKHINHYIGTQDNYYLIAAPFQVDPSTVNGMLDNDFDLYYFASWAPGEEWQNYKADEFFMWDGQGFLYANSVDTDLEFVGEVYPSSDDDYYYGGLYIDSSTDPFNGWSLAGNPFACNAYPVLNDGTAANFYKIDGTELVLSDEDFMRPLEGIFMQETDETTQYYFNRTAPAPIRALDLTVTKVTRGIANCDRVRVRFDQGNNFGKFQLNPDNTKLYITQGNKDFAVVRSEAQGELPVNFKAAANGNYTINVDVKNTEMGYLHLIDNMTGNDVDLLATPSYTFEAKTTDYASRFRLVFSANNVDENAIEDAFAFISNGEIILNGVNGNTTVQVFDVTGRMINSTNGANRIATNNLTDGVYMLRLINGDNVKTQKIVVK